MGLSLMPVEMRWLQPTFSTFSLRISTRNSTADRRKASTGKNEDWGKGGLGRDKGRESQAKLMEARLSQPILIERESQAKLMEGKARQS